MPERLIDANLSSSTAKTLQQAPPSEAEMSEYKTKLAQVYERGLIVDMLQVPLPDDIHGEWFSREANSVTRAEILGYKVDTEFAPQKSKNDHGDGTANVGDVVFMTIPKWKKQMIDDVNRARYYDTHIRDRRKQKEETDFEALNRGIGMPVSIGDKSLVNSTTSEVSGQQIAESLK